MQRGDDATLYLGTGNQFPKFESAIGPEYLQQQGCALADGSTAPLKVLGNDDTRLRLQAPSGSTDCWLQMSPFEVVLDPGKIGLYMQEVRPPQALRDAWSALQARGLPWKERYTKHARIALPGALPRAVPGLGMDAVFDSGGKPPAVGQPVMFQLLRDGRPLPDFAVEMRNENTPIGLWRRTDADGRLTFQPPLPGRWLLRGIDLRLSTNVPDTFDSRFVTLAFDVVTAPRTAVP